MTGHANPVAIAVFLLHHFLEVRSHILIGDNSRIILNLITSLEQTVMDFIVLCPA